MTWNRAQTAQHIMNLDHPDAIRQREMMDDLLTQLKEGNPEVLDGVISNLKLVDPEPRVPLIRVMSEYAHPDMLLPLMRFVFDARGQPKEHNARGLAMQAIMRIASPEHAGKLFDFLMDMKHDDDRFVRGYTAEAIAKFGDARARPILEGMLQADQDDFVKQRVRHALDLLASQPQEASSDQLAQHDLPDEELLQNLRGHDGKDRDYWLGILRERPNSFELTRDLITQGGNKGTLLGLRELLANDDARGREVVVRHLTQTQNEAERAICLRILGKHLRGDASEQEVKLIQSGRHASDLFVQRAALTAGASSGHSDLMRDAIDQLTKNDEHVALDVAKALPQAGAQALKRFTHQVRDARTYIDRRRQHSADETPELIEANLLQTLATLAAEVNIGRMDLQRDALHSLHDALTRWPIVVSALKLLRETTQQEDKLSEGSRWSPSDAAPLLDLLNHENPKVQTRAFELLRYGAPRGWALMTTHLERFLHDDDAPIAEHIIPLLEIAGDRRAEQLLEDLGLSKSAQVSESARATLQRMRNGKRVVEATFVMSDKDTDDEF